MNELKYDEESIFTSAYYGVTFFTRKLKLIDKKSGNPNPKKTKNP